MTPPLQDHPPGAPAWSTPAEVFAERDRLDQLVAELVDLRAVVNAAEARCAEIAHELDRVGDGHPFGYRSTTQFLDAQAGLARGAGRALLDAGRAMSAFPVLGERAHEGRLSIWQTRAIGAGSPHRIAAEDFAAMAPHCTVTQLTRLCRTSSHRAQPDDTAAQVRRRARAFRLRPAADGMTTVSGVLEPEIAAVVSGALRRADRGADLATRDADERDAARDADALMCIAEAYLGADDPSGPSGAPRLGSQARVVVHVGIADLFDLEDDSTAGLTRHSQRSATLAGAGITRADLRRISCDAAVQTLLEPGQGTGQSIGRTSRAPSPALRRRLLDRDGGCVFPTCGDRHGLHAHHLVHWANGGLTTPENLVLLCRFHHWLVHHGNWTIRATATSDGPSVSFADPNGRPPSPPIERPVLQGSPGEEAAAREIRPEPGAARSEWRNEQINPHVWAVYSWDDPWRLHRSLHYRELREELEAEGRTGPVILRRPEPQKRRAT